MLNERDESSRIFDKYLCSQQVGHWRCLTKYKLKKNLECDLPWFRFN